MRHAVGRGAVLRRIATLALALGTLSLAACSSIEPWVKPYERDRLADPIMAFNRDPISDAFFNHVYDSREGARGATGVAGGGCGCN